MLTPEMISQKIQVPRTQWTQSVLFVCFGFFSQVKYATFQNRRAGQKQWCLLRRHGGRRLDGLMWQCWELPVTNWRKQRLQRTFSGSESQKDSFNSEGKDSTTRWKKEITNRFQSRKISPYSASLFPPRSLCDCSPLISVQNTMWKLQDKEGKMEALRPNRVGLKLHGLC